MKIPGSNVDVTIATVWKVIGGMASVVLAWVWIQSQFMERSDFEVYAMGVQAQQVQTTRALLMQELRWLQAQKREAEAAGNTAEALRLRDEIERIKLDIKDLKK